MSPLTKASAVPLPSRSFYFLRHGQTDWNVDKRFQGHTDIPLNDLGVSHAHGAARVLESCAIDVIVSSPLVRALKTAAIVGERLQKPLFIDSELKERHFGSFEGLRVDEVKNRLGLQPHERLAQHLPADAEQWQETRARVIRVMGKWLDRYPDGTILFVAHGGLFDALHEIIFQSRIEPGHVPYFWRHGGDGWTCKAL